MENQSTDADTYFDWRAIFVSQSKPLRFGEAPGLAAGRGRVVFDLADEVFEAGIGRAWHAKPMSAAWVERALAERCRVQRLDLAARQADRVAAAAARARNLGPGP